MRRHNWITIGLTLLIALMIAVSCEKPQNEPGTPEVVTDSLILTDTSVICKGIVESDGGDSIIERGICWYSESYPPTIENHVSPTISDHRMVARGDLGEFSCELTDLEINKVYYLCAYARNSIGVSYGSENVFVYISADVVWVGNTPTPDTPPVPVLMEELPTVTISPVTDITSNQATCHGAITDDGGSAIINRGFCWRTNDDPDYNYICVTESDFAYSLSNLAPNTAYYVRAFAVNEKGIGYSSEIGFTTLEEEEPSYPYLAALYGDNYLGDGQMVELFKEYAFGFTMYSPAGLRSFEVHVDKVNNGTELSYSMNFDEGVESYEYKTNIRFSDRYDRIIKCTVADNDYNYKTVSFRVHINPNTKTSDCEWHRIGGNQWLVIEGYKVYSPVGVFVPMISTDGCSYCGYSITLHINGECTHHNQLAETYESEFVRDYYCDYSDYNGMTYLIHTEKILGLLDYGPQGFGYVISGKVTY